MSSQFKGIFVVAPRKSILLSGTKTLRPAKLRVEDQEAKIFLFHPLIPEPGDSGSDRNSTI